MSRIFVVLVLLLSSCDARAPRRAVVTLATTTSFRDSGLLEVLAPRFERESGVELKAIAVGTGQALEMGRRGDADVLVTHAPEAEQRFVEQGYALRRAPLMHNAFVLVGPQDDPADVAGLPILDALQRIAERRARFVSRGDESGTHQKEKQLWLVAGLSPRGEWYLEGGSGMAATLRIADGRRAYTLTDRGTFLAQGGTTDLAVHSEDSPLLKNHYSVLVVAPRESDSGRVALAQQLADFLLSPETQRLIGEFGKRRYGEPLFYPHASAPSDPSAR